MNRRRGNASSRWRKAAWFIVAVVAGMGVTRAMAEGSTTEVSIDLGDHGFLFRGWGTSLAWWAKGIGDWPDKTLDPVVHLIVDSKDGLGLNVFRYNIGGGDQPGHHHMRRWADVPGYRSAADTAYDWNADSAQRRVLMKLVKASADRTVVEAFSNSAPWWMTISGCVAGSTDGGPNLKPQSEQEFVNYLADVVQHLTGKDGLVFNSLEPFNEPDVWWWKAGKDQEGMCVPRDQQARLIQLLRGALDRRQLRAVRVSATDANSIDDCVTGLRGFNAATLDALGQVNTHSYYGNARFELSRLASDDHKPAWISETGPLNVGGSDYEQIMAMAQRLVLDINQLRPEAWCMWQVVAGGPWGCLHEDQEQKSVSIGKAFYMYAAFTRHIRPGYRFFNLDSDSIVAAISAARNEITIVVVNSDAAPRVVRVKVRGGVAVPPSVLGVFTNADHDLAPLQVNVSNGEELEIEAPARSVGCITASIAAQR